MYAYMYVGICMCYVGMMLNSGNLSDILTDITLINELIIITIII